MKKNPTIRDIFAHVEREWKKLPQWMRDSFEQWRAYRDVEWMMRDSFEQWRAYRDVEPEPLTCLHCGARIKRVCRSCYP